MSTLRCASVELDAQADSKYLQTWVVQASVEETVDSITAAMNQQVNPAQRPSSSTGDGSQRLADRQDRPDWKVLESDIVVGTVWLKYRKSNGFPHDVIIKVHGSEGGNALVRARSRSRMRFLNFRQNRRILSSLTAALEGYWSHHGLSAHPSLDEWTED